MPVVHCRICGAESAPAGRGPSTLGLQRCGDCRLLFLPVKDASAYADQKEQEFFSQMEAGKWQRWLDRGNASAVLRRIQSLRSNGSLLEIGIGRGAFLKAAQRAGYDCFGVEPSCGLRQSAQQQSSIPIFQGTLQEFVASGQSRRFDIIVMNHVLEHIPDPLTALRQIRSLLTDEGIAHIAVPNVQAWQSRLAGWTSYEPYHLYYFSPSTLVSLADRAGFRVVGQRTREPFSGWTNAIIRTAFHQSYQQMRSTGPTPPLSKSRTIAKAVLDIARVFGGAVTLPVRYFQAQMFRGEELITIVSRA